VLAAAFAGSYACRGEPSHAPVRDPTRRVVATRRRSDAVGTLWYALLVTAATLVLVISAMRGLMSNAPLTLIFLALALAGCVRAWRAWQQRRAH
jgi:fatty acid desaturase